jgi:predicted transcriptional regulator
MELKPEQQRVIDLAVATGAYRDPNEVLEQALEIIREQLDFEGWMIERRDEVSAQVQRGFDQAARGELVDPDAALEILRKRRAERLQPRE